VKGFAVNNVIAEGLYRPQAARFEPVTTENLKLLDDSSDPPITLNRDDALYTFSEQWILPMDYSPVDTQGNPLYTAPMLEIKNGDLTVRYQLLFHYKPLHKYTYNFVINSNNITPHLTISMWQDGGATDTDTSPLPLETITLPAISLSAWQPGGTDSDVIN
jgi:hypothetical protein